VIAFRRNIIASYISQLYASLAGILMVPLYVRYMGIEAYGLVGFYAMLQGWFMLLDIGLTPAVSREAARFNGGATEALDLCRLVRSLEGVFVVVGGIALMAMIAGTDVTARNWLKVESLDIADVRNAISLMAVIVVLRWICGLYRGLINGFEHIVWLSGFNAIIATLRFALVVPYLIYVGVTPTHFFAYQLAIAFAELVVLIIKAYDLLPTVASAGRFRWELSPLKKIWVFAASAAFTSTVWVMVMQADKLLLSGLVPLSQYAVYTMGVLVAGGITILSGPVTGAVLPRLVKLSAEGDEVSFLRLYRAATQLIVVVAFPISLVLAFFPFQVLLLWTGQSEISASAARILALYAVGNGILTVAGIPYLLQVARGNLNLHVKSNLIFVFLYLPMLYFAVIEFKMIGAGYAWIISNLLPFLLWLPVVHRKFLPGTHLRWLSEDILLVGLLPTTLAAMLWYFVEWGSGRLVIAVTLAGIYTLLLLAAAISSSAFRDRVRPLMLFGR
jgi:O-antigen/teichoic acid export membrane protein